MVFASLAMRSSASLSGVQLVSALSWVKAEMRMVPCFVVDGADVVAGVVDGTGFVGDGGVAFGGVEFFKIARDHVAIGLDFEHVDGGCAQVLIGGDGS